MRRLILARALFAAACLAAPLVAAPAGAGSLQVDPIRLEISAERRVATLRVRNEESGPVTIRAYGLAWTQPDGEDRYEEVSDLIVSPPVFTIPGGGTQLVRVGLRGAAASGRAYRLMVEEVPEASPGGIQVALRLNLPLFAMVPAGSPADLRWLASRAPDGRWILEAENRGRGFVRIEPADGAAATGISAASGINYGTVLPGSRRRWVLGERPELSDAARFRAIADGQSTSSPR